MKQTGRWLASLLIASGLLIALPSISEAGFRSRTHKPPPKPVYNAIASVNTTAMTITIEPKNSTATATKTYTYTPRTKVTVNGRPATIADLKAGLQIRVGAGMDAGIAEELSASTPPANPK